MVRLLPFLLMSFSLSLQADHHGDGPANPCHQYYPNIPGELLLAY